MSRKRATLIGFSAVLMWALLAVLTIGTAPVPPLQLNAICFAIGGAIGLVWMARGAGFGALRGVGWKVYAAGTLGLFGYHFLYFTAFRLAPYAETGLIAYLWPLFIVLLSGLLPGERLRALHVVGALIAFAGAAGCRVRVAVGKGLQDVGPKPAHACCSIHWRPSSVSRKMLTGTLRMRVRVPWRSSCLETMINWSHWLKANGMLPADMESTPCKSSCLSARTQSSMRSGESLENASSIGTTASAGSRQRVSWRL